MDAIPIEALFPGAKIEHMGSRRDTMDIEHKLKLAEHKQDCMQKREDAERSLLLVEAEDKRLRSIVLRLTGAIEVIEVLDQEVLNAPEPPAESPKSLVEPDDSVPMPFGGQEEDKEN